MQFKVIYIIIICTTFMFSCKQKKDLNEFNTNDNSQTETKETKESSSVDSENTTKRISDLDILNDFVGHYVSEGYPNEFYKSIVLSNAIKGVLNAAISSHNPSGTEMCDLNVEGTVGNGELLLPVVWRGMRVIVTMKMDGGNGLDLYTMAGKNKHALKSFCNNNISLFGHYTRLK